MAAKKTTSGASKREQGVALPIDEAADGNVSRLEKEVKDNPDKPSEFSVAQVQVLHDEEPGG